MSVGETRIINPEIAETKQEEKKQRPALESKLSANAPVFVPGRRSPPPPPSPDIVVYSDSSADLRTTPSDNNETVIVEKALDDAVEKAADCENRTDLIEKASIEQETTDENETRNNGGWTNQNRRRQAQKVQRMPNNEDGRMRIDVSGNERLPGEFVVLDGFRRFVVWSLDLELARGSLGQRRLAVVLMRGVPGSGKTTLAKSLLAKGIRCSADDYFLQEDNSYQFDPTRLEAAHSWCLQRAIQAVSGKVTPVIIDNTNVCLWETAKYVKLAIRNNYDIYFLEPNTDWKYDAAECARRNKHRVPIESIERMLQQFQPISGLRAFVESGIIRLPTKPARIATALSPEKISITQSFSSPNIEIRNQEKSEKSQSPPDDWGSSDSCSLTKEQEQETDDSSLDLQKTSSASSLPKEQRSSTNLPASAASLDRSGSPKLQDLKKTETPPRRRKLNGFGALSGVGLTSGAWQLPSDLVGGLSAAVTEVGTGPVINNASSSPGREILVCDAVTQVTEKHLTLANLQHRRLSRQSVDGCEFELEERTATKSGKGPVVSCDRSVQCEHDGSFVTSADEDGFARGMATLRSCFPQVNPEDIEAILKDGDGQLEWAVNVLLDSGYDVDWTNRINENGNEPGTESGMVSMDQDESQTKDGELVDQVRDVDIFRESSTSDGTPKTETSRPTAVGVPQPPLDDLLLDSENPLYTMELSVDMAKQLQRIFNPLFPGIPSDLLGPSQLKLRMPHHLAADLFRYWLESQVNNSFSDGDSDFFSEGSLPDEQLENSGYNLSEPFGHFPGIVHREDDALAIERQILMDEQFARQLAAEEDGLEPEVEVEQSHPVGSLSSTLASQIKLKRLYELFPSVDRSVLENLFKTNNCNIDRTIDMLSEMYNVPKQPRTGSPGRAYATRAAQKSAACREEIFDATESEEHSYEELRQEARVHFAERQANFQKAQDYYKKGMATVAYYYAQRGHLHNKKAKEANERAAKKMLQQRRAANPGALDLHGLHVSEAMQALIDVLREYKNRPGKEIKIITGQGLHSTNGPKIKPAVINYLRQRNFHFMDLSPGMLLVTIK